MENDWKNVWKEKSERPSGRRNKSRGGKGIVVEGKERGGGEAGLEAESSVEKGIRGGGVGG